MNMYYGTLYEHVLRGTLYEHVLRGTLYEHVLQNFSHTGSLSVIQYSKQGLYGLSSI